MIPLPEIVPINHQRYYINLYDLDPRFRVFEHCFPHATEDAVKWCNSNFGSSALISLPSSMGGGDGVLLSGRWVVWSYRIYISDATDATAFRLVFG